jgi:hypothetical protein
VTYSFRVRLYRSPTDTIQTEANEIVLTVGEETVRRLRLHNPESAGTILNSTQLVLTGDGYDTEAEALAAGERYQSALAVALARHRVGADFGLRAPKGFFTEAGLAMLQQQCGQPVLNSVHGLMAFKTEPKPRFAFVDAKPLRGVNQGMFEQAFSAAVAARPNLTHREKLAYSLFNASFFRESADSRFLLLMMAVEALLEPVLRSDAERAHVEWLIQSTRDATLPAEARNSMVGALRWLLNESISQAGRRLSADRLGNQNYMNMPASKFFSYCYGLRSSLVHGSTPYPAFDAVSAAAGQLEVFVSDLLTVPVLGAPSSA